MIKNSRTQIPSSCPEIKLCEICLPKGANIFDSGWMVTKFIPNAFQNKKVIVSDIYKDSKNTTLRK